MLKKNKNKIKSIVVIFMTAMLFSCVNSVKEVNDFLADKNLPIGESEHVFHVYKDSGNVVFRMNAPLLLDFSNREIHPYSEFPKGIELVTISKDGKDSTTITGNYAISYNKTSVSEIIGDVVVYNHTEKSKLETPQLYWDQKTNYIFTEREFTLAVEEDTIRGKGFESKQDLSGWILKKITGDLHIKEE